MAEVAVISQGDAKHANCAPDAKVECCIGKAQDTRSQSANNEQKGDYACGINPELISRDHFSHRCRGSCGVDAAPELLWLIWPGFHHRFNTLHFLGLCCRLIAFL